MCLWRLQPDVDIGLFAPLLFFCIYTLLLVILYGQYSLKSDFLFLRRKTSGVISRDLLVLVILGFAMSTTYCVASLSGQIITLRVLVTDPAEALADKRSDASAQLYMMEILILWSSRITVRPWPLPVSFLLYNLSFYYFCQPIINDVLIMWRGWSVLSRIRWAKFLAFPLLIIATGKFEKFVIRHCSSTPRSDNIYLTRIGSRCSGVWFRKNSSNDFSLFYWNVTIFSDQRSGYLVNRMDPLVCLWPKQTKLNS